MIDDTEQDALFKERCAVLFERMYGCRIETLPYTSYYAYDYAAHASDHVRLIKCLCSKGIPVDAATIREVCITTVGSNVESVIVTDGRFTEDAWEEYRYISPKVVLIDGDACSRLFMHYSVIPNYSNAAANHYNGQCYNTAQSNNVKELTIGKRLLAVFVSLIVPGGGCFVLYAYTNDKRYIPLGIGFPIISLILLQFTQISNVFTTIVLALYIISIILSFVTLGVRVNDKSATERRKKQILPKNDRNEEYFNEGYKRRYKLSFWAIVLGLFIPGAGAAVLFYISRDKKHILFGNLLFWTSFILVFSMYNFDDQSIIIAAIIIVQILSFVYTILNIDADLKQSMRSMWKGMIALIAVYVTVHLIRGYMRDPEFINRLFQTVLDLMTSLI